MLNYEKSFSAMCKFLLFLFFSLVITFIGISNIFADEILDTSTWVNVTGREWSLSPQEYIYNKTVTNDWVYNYYNITGGIYTPPSSFDYITFSFFQRSGYTFNPCGGEKFNASFKLNLSNTNFAQYVSNIKWNDTSCAYSTSNNSIYDVSCIVPPSSQTLNSIKMYFNEISGTYTSTLAISRNINISCNINTQAIIDNASQNTQNIINNNNTNTQNIIDNQNQNTQDMINSQVVCSYVNNSNCVEDGYINSQGNISTSSNNCVTDYINIFDSNLEITSSSSSRDYLCFYSSNKTKLTCSLFTDLSGELTIPTGAVYFRSTINKNNNVPVFKICKNGNQALSDDINNLDNTLNDDDIGSATSDAGDFVLDFDTNTFGLTSIVTAPLNLIQSITSNNCSPLHLPLPFLNNKYLDLPCMTTIYENNFGALFSLYQTVTFGIISYWIIVRIFNQVKDFKNPEHDEIEVVDL